MQTKRYHIIYDLKNCPIDINKKNLIAMFIRGIAKIIDMKIIKGPVVAVGQPYNPGISGFAIIDFSHISVHTFTKYNEILIDIFSCKNFDKEKARDYCLDFFKVGNRQCRINEVWWGK